MNPIFYLFAIFTLSMGLQIPDVNWSIQKSFNILGHYADAYITSLYYDPTDKISHVVITDIEHIIYYHIALSNSGEILYKNEFTGTSKYSTCKGLIAGPKDGKHIYLALWSEEGTKNVILFSESSDNGKTWAQLQKIPGDGSKRLQDMIYVTETQRLFVFFSVWGDSELRVITRPPNSLVFSREIIVSTNCACEVFIARSAYNYKNGKLMLHLFYKTDSYKLVYTRSLDNGLHWSESRVISSEKIYVVSNAVADIEVTNKVFVSYIISGASHPVYMLYTDDFGDTFNEPIAVTSVDVLEKSYCHGMRICGTQSQPMMATIFTTDQRISEFSLWNLTTMERIPQSSPFSEIEIVNENIDIITNQTTSEIELSAISMRDDYKEKHATCLQYAHGRGSYNILEDK